MEKAGSREWSSKVHQSGGVPAARVFVKPHCLAFRVETLPDALEA